MSGAQVIFSSVLPPAGSNIGRNRWAQFINKWLHGWCHCHNLGFFDSRLAGIRWDSPFSRGKRVRALN